MLDFLLFYPSVAALAVLVFVLAARWSLVPSDRKRTGYVLVTAIYTVIFSAIAEWIANSMSRIRPLKLDEYIYRIDGLFGEPSFLLGRVVTRHLWVEVVLELAYGLLSTVAAAVLVAQLWVPESESEFRVALRAFLLSLLIAPLFYLVLPVCGPQFAFPQFPRSPGHITPHPVLLTAAPNGVPSVHFSTALLILWFARRWWLGRILGVIYLVLIFFATLASGQHYLFDLLVAIPYAATMIAVTRPRRTETDEAEVAEVLVEK